MEFGIRNSELGMNPHPPTVELPAGIVPSGRSTTRSPLQPSQSRNEYTRPSISGDSVPAEVNRCRYSSTGVRISW